MIPIIFGFMCTCNQFSKAAAVHDGDLHSTIILYYHCNDFTFWLSIKNSNPSILHGVLPLFNLL